MNRLEDESRQALEAKLRYTDTEKNLISKIKKAWVFGHVTDVDSSLYSTPEGMSRQLDKFELPQGIVYYYRVNEEGVVCIDKMCVSLRLACVVLMREAQKL